jgi:hypothetical protein
MTAAEIKQYFAGRELPDGPHKIDGFGTVIDFNQYVQANLEGIEKEPNPYFKPCVMRLIALKEWLESHPEIILNRSPCCTQ